MVQENLVDGEQSFSFVFQGREYWARIYYKPFLHTSGGIRKFECWRYETEYHSFLGIFKWKSQVRYNEGVAVILDQYYEKVMTYIGNKLFFKPEQLKELACTSLQTIWKNREEKVQEQERLKNTVVTSRV